MTVFIFNPKMRIDKKFNFNNINQEISNAELRYIASIWPADITSRSFAHYRYRWMLLLKTNYNKKSANHKDYCLGVLKTIDWAGIVDQEITEKLNQKVSNKIFLEKKRWYYRELIAKVMYSYNQKANQKHGLKIDDI